MRSLVQPCHAPDASSHASDDARPAHSKCTALIATRTTTQLLDALHHTDNAPLWAQIDGRYRPVIAALARRLGLNDSDAEEVAQQTLSEFVRAYGEHRYDRTKGRLSSWILGIAHHTTLRAKRATRYAARGGADAGQAEIVDESELRTIWINERDRAILAQAMGLLRSESSADDRTMQAFELVALRGVPASEVARQCAMSVEQVYVAKSRTVKRLRQLVEQLTHAFEEDA